MDLNMNFLVFIDLFILALAVSLLLIKKIYSEYKYTLFVYLLVDLLYQLIMFLTSYYKINNHLVANIYSLINVLLVFFMLFVISNNKDMSYLNYYIIISCLVLAWIFENFIVYDLYTYNFYFPAFSSLVSAFFAFYILNNLSYYNYKYLNVFSDNNRLILFAIVFSSLFSSFLLIFLNFKIQFSESFYKILVFLLSFIAFLSHLVFLYVVFNLIKKKNYTYSGFNR